jgi:hypothetical protein
MKLINVRNTIIRVIQLRMDYNYLCDPFMHELQLCMNYLCNPFMMKIQSFV